MYGAQSTSIYCAIRRGSEYEYSYSYEYTTLRRLALPHYSYHTHQRKGKKRETGDRRQSRGYSIIAYSYREERKGRTR